MTIRRFTAFTLDRVVIYGGISLGTTAACLKAMTYNGWHIPVGAWVAMLAALVGFWGISARLFQLRWRFARSILYYTKHGIAVVPDAGHLDITTTERQAIDAVIDGAVSFWGDSWKPGSKGKILDYLNGGAAVFQEDKLVWHGQGDYAGLEKVAMGLTWGNWMGMMWRSEEPVERMLPLLRHEVSHVCLNALGVEQDDATQHATMRAAGFGTVVGA